MKKKQKTGRKPKTGVAANLRSEISKLVATVEKKSTSEIGYTIKEAMEDLHSIPDIQKGGELYFFAVSMFEHKAKRELWKHLETSEAKVGWLQYQKRKDDPQDKN